MALIIVGGQSRNIGKTSVVTGLISAIPERHWTAVKVTQEKTGLCPVGGSSCRCAQSEHTWTITEEHDATGRGDTCRFLRAGAQRALWVRTKSGSVADAVAPLRRELTGAGDMIFESNSLMEFFEPDLYLPVLDQATADFKASARRFLPRADAIVLHQPAADDSVPAWEGVLLDSIAGKPVFRVQPPQYVTPELVEFVRQRIRHSPRR